MKQWDQQLTAWTVDNRQMSWMNTNGQRLVFTMRKEISDCIKTLEDLAKSHFATGSPLEVPDEIFNYFANFNRLPLPALGSIAKQIHADGDYCTAGDLSSVIGYVLCGDRALTREWPFLRPILLRDGCDSGAWGVLYDISDWERVAPAWVDLCQNYQTLIRTSIGQPIFAALRSMTNDSRVLIFLVSAASISSELGRYSIAVKDNADNIVDSMPFITSRSPTPVSSLAASPQTDLSLSALACSAPTTLDCAAISEWGITNNGPGSAYGVTFSMPVPDGMFAKCVGGSQGHGVITNNTVQFAVGPLASGFSRNGPRPAVPLRIGLVGSASHCLRRRSDDPQRQRQAVSLPPRRDPPTLFFTKGSDYVELSWVSETGHLLPQVGPQLGGSPAWSSLTNGIVADGSRKTLRVPLTASSQFFRLQAPAR